MGTYNSKDVAFLCVGGYNLVSVSNALDVAASHPVTDMTGFGAIDAVFRAAPLLRYEISGHDGWYDDATDSINAAMVGLASGQDVFLFGVCGNTLGADVVGAERTLKTEYVRGVKIGEYTQARLGVTVSKNVKTAKIVAPLTSRAGNSGDTKSTALDLGTTDLAGGLAMYMSCPTLHLDGSTSLTINIEHSTQANMSGSAVYQAFTNLTAIGSEYKNKTTAVNRYVAISYTFNTPANTPAASFVVAVAKNTNTGA